VRRCAESWKDGRFMLEQETNAYAILPDSQWRGYTPPPQPPTPQSDTWGATPPLPPLVAQAAAESAAGGSLRRIVGLLDSDPTDELAATLAQLGRTLGGVNG
jgi:hypothetical protein